jgi:PAS domain S-box-containing protein
MGARVEDRRGRPAWIRYGAAALLVVLATVLTVAFQSWLAPTPLAPFFAAVAIAAWFGGFGPAVAAIVLSVPAIAVWALPPYGIFGNPADVFARLLTFVVVAVVISALSASRDRAEAALRGSERRFRTILETANEGVWLIDRHGRTQYANDRMAALLGTTPQRLATTPVLDFVFAEDVPQARERIAANLAGRPEEFDFRFRRDDGSETLVLAGTSPVRDDAGRVVGALGLFTDVTARRQAQAALARANERFALAADAVQALIYEWDIATNRVERSEGLFALLGFHPEEVPAHQSWWTERIHPDDLAHLALGVPQRQPGPDRYANEYRVRHRDGHWVTVLDQARIIRDATGERVRVIGSTTDITARVEAENAVRFLDEAGKALASSLDYEETLQRVAWLAVPALADWCLVDLCDDSGAIRRVAVAYPDPAAEPLAAMAMRYPPTPAVKGPAIESMATGAAVLIERVDEAYFAATAQDETHREMLETLAPVSLMAVPLRAGGPIHGAMTMLTSPHSGRRYDRDDLALAEQVARRAATAIENARLYQEVQEAEARYRGLFEGTHDAILVADARARIVDANAAMVALSGYTRQELRALPMGTLSGNGAAWAREEVDRLRQEGIWRGEWMLRRKDGALVPVESTVTAIALPSGPLLVGVSRDISERKHVEQVHQEFIATVAHDLKNPLTAMRGQTQLLRRRLSRGEAGDAERIDASLEMIDNAAEQMTSLLDELADVMRLRAGEEIELRRMPTDLVPLVREAIETYARTSERHEIRFEAAEERFIGNWDGPRLERVLGNLLGNAIKYSPGGGEIAVRLRRERAADGDAVALSVEDRGVGIPATDLPLVFQRFRRAGNVSSIAGSGIGLAGAKRIVELHGGTISVASVEGQGSTFTVRLPLADTEGNER